MLMNLSRGGGEVHDLMNARIWGLRNTRVRARVRHRSALGHCTIAGKSGRLCMFLFCIHFAICGVYFYTLKLYTEIHTRPERGINRRITKPMERNLTHICAVAISKCFVFFSVCFWKSFAIFVQLRLSSPTVKCDSGWVPRARCWFIFSGKCGPVGRTTRRARATTHARMQSKWPYVFI